MPCSDTSTPCCSPHHWRAATRPVKFAVVAPVVRTPLHEDGRSKSSSSQRIEMSSRREPSGVASPPRGERHLDSLGRQVERRAVQYDRDLVARCGGEGVQVLACKTLQRGDQIRRDALRHYRMQRTQVGVVAVQPGTV